MAKKKSSNLNWFVIGGIILAWWFIDNYAITVTTVDQNINQLANFPYQLPLKDIIFNTPTTPSGLIKVYLDKVGTAKLLP